MTVDFDYHHGDGTQSIFYDDDRVLFLSTHRYTQSTSNLHILHISVYYVYVQYHISKLSRKIMIDIHIYSLDSYLPHRLHHHGGCTDKFLNGQLLDTFPSSLHL